MSSHFEDMNKKVCLRTSEGYHPVYYESFHSCLKVCYDFQELVWPVPSFSKDWKFEDVWRLQACRVLQQRGTEKRLAQSQGDVRRVRREPCNCIPNYRKPEFEWDRVFPKK